MDPFPTSACVNFHLPEFSNVSDLQTELEDLRTFSQWVQSDANHSLWVLNGNGTMSVRLPHAMLAEREGFELVYNVFVFNDTRSQNP